MKNNVVIDSILNSPESERDKLELLKKLREASTQRGANEVLFRMDIDRAINKLSNNRKNNILMENKN